MAQRIFSSADFQDPPARGSRSGGGSVAARVVSALIGLIVTVPALFLVMAGGARGYSESLRRLNPDPVAEVILLLGAGLLLLLIVALSGVSSALGPLIGGILAAGFGTAFLVDPMLVGPIAGVLPSFGASPSDLLIFWGQSGLLLVTGVVLLASALARVVAARTGRGGRGGAKAIVSLIVSLVATPAGVVLVALGARDLLAASSTAPESTSESPAALGMVLLLAGAAVLAGVTLTTGWSSLGAGIVGAVVLVLGLAALLPQAVLWIFGAVSPLSADIGEGVTTLVVIGFVSVCGVLLLGASVSASRGRRSAR